MPPTPHLRELLPDTDERPSPSAALPDPHAATVAATGEATSGAGYQSTVHASDGDALSPGTLTETPAHKSDGVDDCLAPGVVIGGQYELIRELGRGGMGLVYLARDIRLGRLVAVKFVLVRNVAASQRFLAEARTTARCTHPNIVVIHGADEFQGLPYMVLEYLPGRTLRQLMRERAASADSDARGLSVARTLEIMLPVLRALERAHAMSIAHRDLKPENIMLTDAGVVKVLDFGIAKSVGAVAAGDMPMGADRSPTPNRQELDAPVSPGTAAGSLVGTLPYMSPEQLSGGPIDRQVDVWAVGIMLFEMIAGHHPLAPLSRKTFLSVADVAIAMPRAGDLCPTVGPLGPIIDRCLLKNKADRVASVTELLAELEPHMPGHRNMSLADEDSSPFTGLSAFQESDADRFFGRSQDTLSVVSRVREQPLVALIGPSGAGKSSLVRAGVIPMLKRSGEGWQSYIARPGRAPLLALAEIADHLERLTTTGSRRISHELRAQSSDTGNNGDAGNTGSTGDRSSIDRTDEPDGRTAVVERLRAEPGYLGATLRLYAQRRLRRVVLFIDQFEEVYTLCSDDGERAAFLACLAGVADDVGSPLRVVLSMRADFLERLAENRSFMTLATRGLMLLPPMGRAGLQAALEKPLAAAGYRFESQHTVRDMLDGLDGTRGALPLLQFAAATLWRERDRARRLLTEDSYRAMGGIAGTLAKHADSVVAAMTAERRKLARAVFERLVTPDRTRAVVSVGEMRELGSTDADAGAVDEVLEELARARLLVVDTGTVEIVHESLIDGWPTLRRWLDEHQDDAAFLARLRTAAREWQASGRADGMLWRGQPAAEAMRWRQYYTGELSGQEQRFLDAVFAITRRAQVRRRRLIYASVAVLVLLVVAGAYAITKGQNEAALARSLTEAHKAREEAATAKQRAEQQAEAARAATVAEAAAKQEAERQAREAREAQAAATAAQKNAEAANAGLEAANARITALLATTERERERAVVEAADAEIARKTAESSRQNATRALKEAEQARSKLQEVLKQNELDKLDM